MKNSAKDFARDLGSVSLFVGSLMAPAIFAHVSSQLFINKLVTGKYFPKCNF